MIKITFKQIKLILFVFVLFFALVFLQGSKDMIFEKPGYKIENEDLVSQINFNSSRSATYKVSGYVRTSPCWVPIPDVTVYSVPATRYGRGKCRRFSAVTDNNGYYEITGLVAGKYALKVDIDDRDQPYFFMPTVGLKTAYASTMVSEVVIGSSDITDVNFEKTEIPPAESGFIKPMSYNDINLKNYGWTYAEKEDKTGILGLFHPGQDYNSFKNESDKVPIYAVADGVVVDVRPDKTYEWGGIVIKHWNREHWYWGHAYYSQYGHISVDTDIIEKGIQKLEIGQIVHQGDLIGYEDKIGYKNKDYHLHFEIRNFNHPYPYDRDYYGDKSCIQLKQIDNIYSWYEHPDSFIASDRFLNRVIVIDEMESHFSSSGNLKGTDFDFDNGGTLGFGGYMKYAITNNKTTAWGKWSIDITWSGNYEIEAFIPRNNGTSIQAQYELDGVYINPTLNQNAHEDEWVKLGSGSYYLSPGTHYLKLENNTGETGQKLAYDAIRVTFKNSDSIRPSVNWFRINLDVENTEDRTVFLNNKCSGNPTHYKASEFPNFKDSTWKIYSEAPEFYLKGGFGEKKIFFKVKNQYRESNVLKDTIRWDQNSLPFIASFKINNGAESTINRTVTLNNGATRNPTHYIASENSNFAGAIWKTYSDAPSFILSPGNGIKEVFLKVKNQDGVSGTASDTIELKQAQTPSITSFEINNGAQCTSNTVVTLNNSVTGSPTLYMASENADFTGASWQLYSSAPSFTLSAFNGTKQVFLKVKNTLDESGTVSDTILKIQKYSAVPTITTDGGGTWGNVLKLKATFSCATLTLTVTKIDDTPWQTSGTLYFRLDDYDEDGILITDPVNPVHINAGILSFSYNVDLTKYSGTFPRKFFVLFDSEDVLGQAWVGPITIIEE